MEAWAEASQEWAPQLVIAREQNATTAKKVVTGLVNVPSRAREEEVTSVAGVAVVGATVIATVGVVVATMVVATLVVAHSGEVMDMVATSELIRD